MKNIKLFSLLIFLIGMYGCSSEANTKVEGLAEIVETTPPIELSLYDRLGAAEGISSIVDDIISTHLANPIVSVQFAYLKDDPERIEMLKKYTREFLGAGTGGTEIYTGNDVTTVHKGMNITEAEFLAAIDDILLVLDKHNMSDQTKKDMLYILYSFKSQVIAG